MRVALDEPHAGQRANHTSGPACTITCLNGGVSLPQAGHCACGGSRSASASCTRRCEPEIFTGFEALAMRVRNGLIIESMKPVVIFGAGEFAEVAHYYFTH